MEAKNKDLTAVILKGEYCNDCGWPVIKACCNDDFTNYKNSAQWDWWKYCSNKGCKNHHGDGIYQDDPEWISAK